MSEVDAVAEVTPKRRVVQFQSYPWWTDVQKEGARDCRQHSVQACGSKGQPCASSSRLRCASTYQTAFEQASEDVMSEAVSAVLSVAASQVILDETPWEDALAMAMNRATSLWPVGSINAEEVARKAKRAWARSGRVVRPGALPEVRDKRGSWETVNGLKTLGKTAVLPNSLRTGVAWRNCSLNRSNWCGVWPTTPRWPPGKRVGSAPKSGTRMPFAALCPQRRQPPRCPNSTTFAHGCP